MTGLRALIFDVDGTLAETEEAHRQAFNATFAAHGLDWTWSVATYTGLLRVTGGKERMAAYRDSLGQGAPDAAAIAWLHAEKTERFAALMAGGGISPRPGVTDLMQAARAAGMRLAVATTTSPANVEALCRALWGRAAREMFDVIAAGDEVAAKKPAPDVYLLALRRLGLQPDQALAVEDSRNGILAARAAGVPVVVTPSVFTRHEDLSGATLRIDDLAAVTLADLAALRPAGGIAH